jgi:hypothetical protein
VNVRNYLFPQRSNLPTDLDLDGGATGIEGLDLGKGFGFKAFQSPKLFSCSTTRL